MCLNHLFILEFMFTVLLQIIQITQQEAQEIKEEQYQESMILFRYFHPKVFP